MPRTLDTLTSPLSPEEAYCIGGILSCCTSVNENKNKTAWLLQVIHNPNIVPNSELNKHKRNVKIITAPLGGKEIKKSSRNYKKCMPGNKDGFVFSFSSSLCLTETDILSYIHNLLNSEPIESKTYVIAGAFDGRSSWDKHTRRIVLDCVSVDSGNLIKTLLDEIGITYDYNTNRDRKSGNPRKPQLRITAPDIPLFMKKIGFISPFRCKCITDMSKCSFITRNNCGLPGLTQIDGLLLSKTGRKFHSPSDKEVKEADDADEALCDTVLSTKFKVPSTPPTRSGKPKPKSIPKSGSSKSSTLTYGRDEKVAQRALEIASFKCEYNGKDKTFIRRKDNLPYTEPHHLVPLAFSDDFDVSLDIEENVVSLCSNCHKQIHYGKDFESILHPLYEARKDMLATVGIFITYDELVAMYKKLNRKR